MASLAAAAVILGGGGYAISQVASTGPTTSSNGRAAAEHPPIDSVPGSEQSGPPAVGALGPMKTPAYLVVASGADYQPSTLRTQVASTIARYLPTRGPARTAPSASGGTHRFGPPAGLSDLSGCVRRVAGALQPDLVDVARYAGQPAIVIAARSGSGQEVWVVGTNCSATGARIYARLNLTGRG